MTEMTPDANAADKRKPYRIPEVVRLRVRSAGDNVLGACKTAVGDSSSQVSTTCDVCSNIGS
jgi:hypothetical protein